MKIIKRTFLIVILFAVSCFLFRGWLFRQMVSYEATGQRKVYRISEKQLLDFIEEKVKVEKNPDVRMIIDLSLDMTASNLNFVFSQADADPNKLISSKRAHCVGYTAFNASICNFLFEKFKLSDEWIASHQVGQLYFMSENIHSYFTSAFFKDHDFVIIQNSLTGEKFAIDPAVYDYVKIAYVSLKQ